MKEHKLSIGKVIAIIFLALFTIFMILGAISAASDIVWYSNALDAAKDKISGDITLEVTLVMGHDKIENAPTFNKNCYVNQTYSYMNDNEWVTAAKALYDATGLQLYYVMLDAPVGYDTGILNTEDAKQYCLDYIETLPNVETSIVVYEFHGDEYAGKWITVYETLYFGDRTLDYLSVSDMEMIQYIYEHDYDIFTDYNNRTVRIWELISSNLVNGYNRNLYNGSYYMPTEWDFTYYREERNAAIGGFIILAILSLLGVIGFIVLFYVNFILHPRRVQAEIDIAKAHADKIILEADVKRVPDAVDELEQKYLNGGK